VRSLNAARHDARGGAFVMTREPSARLDLAIGQAKTRKPN
jgi:hypothetical protein